MLEELFETPVLRKEDLDHDTASHLKNYSPPVLATQVEAALSAEFGRHLVRTDWSAYEDPLVRAEHDQAARLIGYTLATMRRTIGTTGSLTPPAPPQTRTTAVTEQGEADAKETAPTDEVSPPTTKALGAKTEAWIRRECDQLLGELETGATDRWERAEHLVGRRRWAKLTTAQQDALGPAVSMVGRNPHLHPVNKRRIINTIADTIIKTIQ